MATKKEEEEKEEKEATKGQEYRGSRGQRKRKVERRVYERFAVTASAARRPAATFVAAAAPLCLFLSFTHAADDAAVNVLRFKSAIVPEDGGRPGIISPPRRRRRRRTSDDDDDDASSPSSWSPSSLSRSVSLVPMVPLSLLAASSHCRCYYYYYYYYYGHHRHHYHHWRRRRR